MSGITSLSGALGLTKRNIRCFGSLVSPVASNYVSPSFTRKAQVGIPENKLPVVLVNPVSPSLNSIGFSSRTQVRSFSTKQSPQFQDLNPKKWGYDEDFVKELYLGIRTQVDQLPDSAIKIIKRTGIDGMSLGALNAPAWYGLVLFTNLLRLAIEDKVKPSQLDPSYGFTHTAGEGGIPNVADFF